MKLWKHNRVDKEWQASPEDISFAFWADTREDPGWLNGWPLDRALREFITRNESDGGLGSTFDEAEYMQCFEVVRDDWPKDLT